MRASTLLALGVAPVACVEIDPSYGNVSGSSGVATSATTAATGTEESGGSTSGSSDDDPSTGPATGTNLAFVSSTTVFGDFGGFDVADATCNQLAQAAGLPGTYVAWLSDSTQDAVTRLGSASGWVRTDGRVFARDRSALVSAAVSYPLYLDEAGALVGASLVFTGTDGSGVPTPETCGDWQSAATKTYGTVGFADGGGGVWSLVGGLQCDADANLYCLGVDYDAPVEVPAPPADARIVFATSAQIPADAGRDAADDLCASEASAAGLDGTFLALMAVPGETLFERHDLSGGPWVRPDGVIVFPDGADPAQWSELLQAPVAVTALGQLVIGTEFWAGVSSTTEVADATTTCNGWTDTAYPDRPRAWTIYARWLDPPVALACDAANAVVCLEQ